MDGLLYQVMEMKEREDEGVKSREKKKRKKKRRGEMRCDEWGMPDRAGGESRHAGSILL